MLATKTALTIEAAKAIAAACEAAAKKDRLKLVIAIVDDGGHLVLLHRDDGAQVGSVEIATLKARTAVLFKRPTKAFQDVVEGQGRYRAAVHSRTASRSTAACCLKSGDEIIGAIGVSRRKRRAGRRHRPHRRGRAGGVSLFSPRSRQGDRI